MNAINEWKASEVGMTVNEWAKDFKSFVNELQMPRDDYKGIMEYIDNTISLLKEQEAIEPIAKEDDTFECVCGAIVGWEELDSSGIVTIRFNYCPFCGKAVKWK